MRLDRKALNLNQFRTRYKGLTRFQGILAYSSVPSKLGITLTRRNLPLPAFRVYSTFPYPIIRELFFGRIKRPGGHFLWTVNRC